MRHGSTHAVALRRGIFADGLAAHGPVLALVSLTHGGGRPLATPCATRSP
jgi:hypothetical protein